jgi:hypothetical protein
LATMQKRGWLPESAVPFRLRTELLKLAVPQPRTARSGQPYGRGLRPFCGNDPVEVVPVVEVHHVARVDVLGHKAEPKMARFGSVALHTPRLKITLPASARTLISGLQRYRAGCVLRYEPGRRSETERRIARCVISWLLFLGAMVVRAEQDRRRTWQSYRNARLLPHHLVGRGREHSARKGQWC